MKNKITDLLANKKYNALFEYLDEQNVVDISFVMGELDDEEMIRVFRLLSKDKAVNVFSYMESDVQGKLISIMTDKELERVTSEMFIDDTVALISEMPATLVKRILKAADPADRKIINDFLQYPDDSAGSLMTIEFIELKSTMTVVEAINKIREDAINKETIYTCYVLDDSRILIGIVTVKDLLLANLDTPISEIMETNIITANTVEDKEEVAKKMGKYDLLALPVVDLENRLVGIITIDDAVDVLLDESQEDFSIMAAVSPSENTYFKTSVFKHARNRIPWLLILMVSSTITGAIISKYENAFATLPLLVSFIPMLMDTGGNCGSQASILIIRGMATDEIFLKDYFKAVWKEFRVALICSAALSIANGLRVWLQYDDPYVAFIVATTLIGTIIIAKVLGCSLPMLARKIHLDPAIMSSPFITTLVDSFSVFLYFNIALRVMDF